MARLGLLGAKVDLHLGASREPFRDAAVRERLTEGIAMALAFCIIRTGELSLD